MRFTTLLLAAFTATLCAQEKPKLVDLTREELEKLGGFEAMPPDPLEYNIEFELLMTAFPADEALRLIPRLKDPAQVENACTDIQRMLTEQKARLVSALTLTTKSGNRCVAEDIQEIRYPIEFEGPKFAALKKDGNTAEKGDAKREQSAGNREREAEPPSPKLEVVDVIPPTPTTFETRNAGCTLEIEPVLDPSTFRIDAQLAAQHVYLAQYEKHTVSANGREITLQQPRFKTNKVQTNLTLQSGRPILLGSFTSSKEPGWVELFVMRATARVAASGKAASGKDQTFPRPGE